MKIIVLAGGLSTERDVSLSSAAGICRTLVEKGHDAFLLDVIRECAGESGGCLHSSGSRT